MLSNVETKIEKRISSNDIPKNLEIEKAFLACLILDQTNIEHAINLDINETHFYDSRHIAIYDAIVDIKYNKGCNVDLVLIKDSIKRNRPFEHYDVTDIALYLMSLEEVPVCTGNIKRLCETLEDYRQRRQIIQESRLAIEKARNILIPIDTNFLTHGDGIKKLDIAKCLENDPPPRKWIFENFLPQGVVASLNASGGTGKSYLALYFAISVATGTQIFQNFKPAHPRSVICCFGEDAEEVLWERLRIIVDSHEHLDLELLDKNLNIFCENATPLMELEINKPVLTKSYAWLRNRIKEHNPGLVIIDPKSKYYGLDEICNSHAAIWLNNIQQLITPDATILILHHVNKTGASTFDSASARGASAFIDGCRWAANLRVMDADTGAKFNIYNYRQYIELLIVKSNYTALPTEPIRFRHVEGGGLQLVEPHQERFECIASLISDVLKSNPEKLVSCSEIIKESQGKFVRDFIKESEGKISRDDLNSAIDCGLKSGSLYELEIQAGTKKRKIITA